MIRNTFPFNTLNEAVLSNQSILLRVDFNVPIINGEIIDYTRIDSSINTINYLLKNNAKIIIATHIGRPNGQKISSLSTKILQPYLQKILRCKVHHINESIGITVSNKISTMEYREVLLLENIRFHLEEEKCDFNFAKALMSNITIYVNDAFSCSHRTHSSILAASMFTRAFAGLNFEKEYSILSSIEKTSIRGKKIAIIGGAKISTKLDILKNLIHITSEILIGGAMMNTFLKSMGKNIGKSMFEPNLLENAIEIMNLAKYSNCNILIPTLVVVAKNLHSDSFVKSVEEIAEDDIILDVAPNYLKDLTSNFINADLILWNGPLGMFEIERYSKGSAELIEIISQNKTAIKISGGGESCALINKLKKQDNFSFISTAGGAFLDFISGKILPGLKVLEACKFNF